MSLESATFNDSVFIRGGEAEVIGFPAAKVKLLVDGGSTSGALSTVRASLDRGADGAPPHRHNRSSEMFYVLEGALEVLCGKEVVTAEVGDVLVIPPGMTHAFAAAPDIRTKVLIVIAPGIERFEYFRLLARIFQGQESFDTLRGAQQLYDTYFLQSPEWDSRRVKDLKLS